MVCLKRTSKQVNGAHVEQPEPKRQKFVAEASLKAETKKSSSASQHSELAEESKEESSDYDSEEERRREQEQLKQEIIEHLQKRQEPLTMQ